MQKAEWIWLSGNAEPDEYATFADEFWASSDKKSVLRISAAGDYNVYINGKLSAFGQYADYAHYKIYDEIDISRYLICGKNEITVTGWYIGKSSLNYRDCGAGIAFEIDCDGEIAVFSHEGMHASLAAGYVSHTCKTITPQLGFSYVYDTRDKICVWDKAVRVKGFDTIVPRPNEKTMLGEFISAHLIDGERKVYDLGRECCGFLNIVFNAPQGEKIAVTFGEHLDDGEVRRIIDGRDFSVELIGCGDRTEFSDAFRRLGCRYLQITGNAEIESIGVREPNYPLKVIPYDIKDPLRRKIYETSLNTLRLCLHEHYEDCPWREQTMYITDTRNQMLCGYYAFDNPECALAAIRLMAAGQKENGLFDICFPSDAPFTIPSFSLMFAVVVTEFTKKARNTFLAEEMFSSVEKLLEYFLSRIDESGLLKTVSEDGLWHFYEWAGSLDGSFFASSEVDKNRNGYDSLINAFLSLALESAAELCVLLGKFDKADDYRKRKSELDERIHEVFFVSDTCLFKTYADKDEYSELANALCVLADICSGKETESIAEKLANGFDGWTQNTLSMNIFRYDALLKTNCKKYANFVLKDIDRIYGKMLREGATTFWETEKGAADFDGAGSLCHGWSAIPIYYYRILGVCGERESMLDDAFRVRDNPTRKAYADAVCKFADEKAESCILSRDKILYLPERIKRSKLCKLLGEPLGEKWKTTKLIKREHILTDGALISTRYTFLLNGNIPFSGILYENTQNRLPSEKLIFTLHGGGGTSETVGDLLVPSSNYNHMVRRLLRRGVKLFAPQLLLWNPDIYGECADREQLNRKLIQLGGSITAFELQCLMRTLDWWEKDIDTDTSNFGVAGLSYGGMYALYLTALDTRVKHAYSSCWFGDRLKHNWHDWTYFNAAHSFLDAEVGSLVFPRKLYIELARGDEAFPASDSRTECERLTRYAEHTGNADRLHIKEFDGGHELDKNGKMLEEFVHGITGIDIGG